MSIFKKQPDDNWLIDLDKYRMKEKPKGKWDCEGPWYSDDGEDGVLMYLFKYINSMFISKNVIYFKKKPHCFLSLYKRWKLKIVGALNFLEYVGDVRLMITHNFRLGFF